MMSVACKILKILEKNIKILNHFGRDEDRTIGVSPRVKRFLVLLKFTMLKMIRWSTCTLSTEKLNQNLTIREGVVFIHRMIKEGF